MTSRKPNATLFLSLSTLLYTDTRPNWFLINRALSTIGLCANCGFANDDFDCIPLKHSITTPLSLDPYGWVFIYVWNILSSSTTWHKFTQNKFILTGSSRQGVGTVHASSNFAGSHHYESYITCVPHDWLPAGFTGPGSDWNCRETNHVTNTSLVYTA